MKERIYGYQLSSKGGKWLAAARSFLQWNVPKGDSLIWGSNETVTLTVKQIEELLGDNFTIGNFYDIVNNIRLTGCSPEDYSIIYNELMQHSLKNGKTTVSGSEVYYEATDIEKLIEQLQTEITIQKLTSSYLTCLECSIEDFIGFMPLYLYAFLYIKQQFGYSEDSIQRTQESISQLYKLEKIAV